MPRIRTPLDAELLKGLKRIVESLKKLRMLEADNQASSDCQRGISDAITEIESSINRNGNAAAD
jgi:hypothetical protein